jgi:hypothetical protein
LVRKHEKKWENTKGKKKGGRRKEVVGMKNI